MFEQTGNLWELVGPDDILVITTNGFVRKDGSAVMGRGIAYQATQHDPDVDKRLGKLIKNKGNPVHLIHINPYWLSFPVKHGWFEKADLSLIERSTQELKQFVDTHASMYDIFMDQVYLPRPGCGNGRLKWEDVKPVIEPYLDDRFIVVTYEKST